MSTWALIIVTLLYVGSAVDLALKHDWGLAVVFSGYSLANLGLLLSINVR